MKTEKFVTIILRNGEKEGYYTDILVQNVTIDIANAE